MRAPVLPSRIRSAGPDGRRVPGVWFLGVRSLGVRSLRVRSLRAACDEAGSVATEIALLATLVAGATLGVAAVVGGAVEHPLEAVTTVLHGLTGSGG